MPFGKKLDSTSKDVTDTTRFGAKILEKHGWKLGKGLGSKEDGITTNLKVVKKTDKKGIGHEQTTEFSWLDNSQEYDNFLSSLSKFGQCLKTTTSCNQLGSIEEKSSKTIKSTKSDISLNKRKIQDSNNGQTKAPLKSSSKVNTQNNQTTNDKINEKKTGSSKIQGAKHYIPRRVLQIKLAVRTRNDLGAILASTSDESIKNRRQLKQKDLAEDEDPMLKTSTIDMAEYFRLKKESRDAEVEKLNKQKSENLDSKEDKKSRQKKTIEVDLKKKNVDGEVNTLVAKGNGILNLHNSSKKRKFKEFEDKNKSLENSNKDVASASEKRHSSESENSSAAAIFAAGIEGFRIIENQLVSSNSKLSLGMFPKDKKLKQKDIVNKYKNFRIKRKKLDRKSKE